MSTTTTADGLGVYCRFSRLADPRTLAANPANNRIHPTDQLGMLGSLLRGLGWHASIVVSRRSGFIVKGHGTTLAAIAVGLTEVPVEEQDYETEAAELADLVADNRIQEFSYQDADKLRGMIRRIEAEGGRLDLTGYDSEMVRVILQAGGRQAVVMPIAQQAAPEQQPAASIRQVLLIYSDHEFMRLALAMQKICAREKISNPSDAVLHVLRKRHASHNPTPKTD